jgi:hypothetical protein
MGLLNGALDNDMTRFGLGLLAASGPTNDPQKGAFGNRLMQAVGSFDDYRKEKAQAERAKRQEEFQAFQMEQAREQAARQAKLRGLAQEYQTPAEPERKLAPLMGDSIMPDAFKSGILPTQGTTIPAKPAGFNFDGYANALAGIDPVASLELQAKLRKDNSLTPVAAGTSLYNPRTKQVEFTAPATQKPENLDPKIEQYQYARANGYKDSFEQFVTLGPTIMANAQAPLRQAQIGNINAENDYNLPAPRPAAKPNAPMKGQVVQGYRFKGGNPADQSNWEKQ